MREIALSSSAHRRMERLADAGASGVMRSASMANPEVGKPAYVYYGRQVE
ncbi:MAG: hypothetical protein HY277_01930 [Ignavibacteriales bacterium]|nr:hypothetical protein [Ignavibacteriales bacterium]